MSNSIDPGKTAHLDLCCLQKPIIIACSSERVNPFMLSLRRLIWVYTVCQCPVNKTLGLNGLSSFFSLAIPTTSSANWMLTNILPYIMPFSSLSAKASAVILSRKKLKSVGDRRHPCLSSTIVLNRLFAMPMNIFIFVFQILCFSALSYLCVRLIPVIRWF